MATMSEHHGMLSSLIQISNLDIPASTGAFLNELLTDPDQKPDLDKLLCLQMLINAWTKSLHDPCSKPGTTDHKLDTKVVAIFDQLIKFSVDSLKKGDIDVNSNTRPCLLHIFGKCFSICSLAREEWVCDTITRAFSDYAQDLKLSIEHSADHAICSEGKLDIHTAVDLIGLILNTDKCLNQKWLSLISNLGLKLITISDAEISGKIIGIVVSKILNKSDNEIVGALLEQTWKSVEQIHESQTDAASMLDTESRCERPFLILCGFANWFFPVNWKELMNTSLLSRDKFWEILQFGFYQNDSLTRKRALYILKRILDITETNEIEYPVLDPSVGRLPYFQWTKERKSSLGNTWQDYILLIETLEEKQVHVIKPLMPRFATLVTQTFTPEERPLLHTSWILTLLRRITAHESAFIKRWGFMEFLKIDMREFPLVKQNGTTFLQDHLVALLAESSMYYKPTEMPLGSCHPVGEATLSFLPTCLEALESNEDRSRFVTTFVHNMLNHNWSGTALVHVACAIASLSPTLACGEEVVKDIREILQVSMGSLEIYLRGALQCYMASAAIRIIDPSLVGPANLTPLLAILRWDESMARNSVLWKEYVKWLKAVVRDCPQWQGGKLGQFIQTKFNLQTTEDQRKSVVGNGDILAVVRLCLLSLDAGVFDNDGQDKRNLPVETFLRPVVSTLLTINTHVYMSATKANHVINVLVTFLKNCESKLTPVEDPLVEKVKKMANECVGEVVLYSCRKMTDAADHLHAVEEITFYVKTLENLGTCGLNIFASSHIETIVIQLMAAHWQKEQTTQSNLPSMETQLGRYAGMKFMGFVAKQQLSTMNPGAVDLSIRNHIIASWSDKKPIHDFSRAMNSENKGCESLRGQGQSTWGRVSAEFISGQWYCMALLLNTKLLTQEEYNTRQEWCMEALSLTSGRAILPIIECLKIILRKVDSVLEDEAVRFTWRKVMEESRNTMSFWICWKTFTEAVFQPELLNNTDERVRKTLSDLMEEVFTVGMEKQGLVNVMISRLCDIWRRDDYTNMNYYVDAIVSAVMFGPIHDKSRKQCQESVAYLSELGDTIAVNQLIDGNARNDNHVRAMILSALSHLRVDEHAHQELASNLIKNLCQKHREINQVRTYRDFINSLAHREKHRIVVAVLVLEAFVYNDHPEEMVNVLMELLSTENHSSVRVMVEWLVIRVLLHKPSLFHKVLKAIQKSDEKRMAYLCSLFTIATHLVMSTTADKQEELMLQLIPNLLPWCTMHHFNCRTFAQACIIMLWQTCQEQNLQTAIRSHSVLQNLVDFQKTNINQSRGTQKLLDNFFFHFDPIQDYSIETLLLTLPRLTCIQDDEWIHPNTFTHLDPSWLVKPSSPTLLPLLNQRRVLDNCEAGTWKVKFVDPDTFEVTEGNVQKKIIPWISMLPEQDLEGELEEELATKRSRCGELILVTSLIDKVPNLGGLCRTSEIFGVSEFVIGNLKHTKVHEFESLSVTAHKWIPIKEVRPHMLKTYLLEMKNEGYTLVGAEQTADSVSLREYTFPRKTLLILGNEKEGIPVDLIQLLDVCVEIPQQGVIRSLNVHVSGALLVWEYTRQWLSNLEK